MNPLVISGIIAAAGLLGKWAGRGFRGSPFESDQQYWMRHFDDLIRQLGLRVRTPEDYRKSVDIVYGSQRASTEATASQRAMASGLGGYNVEALVSRAVQPIDIARLSAETEILEAADKSLMQAVNLALSYLQGMPSSSPFEFGLGLGAEVGLNIFSLLQDIALGKQYIDIIERYLQGLNK